MSETEAPPAGPGGSLRRITDSLLGMFETRLQLFVVELQCERLRMLEHLLWLAVAVGIGLIGLLLAVVALAIYLWQVSRFVGLIALAIVFLAGAGILLRRLRAGIRNSPAPFAETLAEFKKDRACLQGKN